MNSFVFIPLLLYSIQKTLLSLVTTRKHVRNYNVNIEHITDTTQQFFFSICQGKKCWIAVFRCFFLNKHSHTRGAPPKKVPPFFYKLKWFFTPGQPCSICTICTCKKKKMKVRTKYCTGHFLFSSHSCIPKIKIKTLEFCNLNLCFDLNSDDLNLCPRWWKDGEEIDDLWSWYRLSSDNQKTLRIKRLTDKTVGR